MLSIFDLDFGFSLISIESYLIINVSYSSPQNTIYHILYWRALLRSGKVNRCGYMNLYISYNSSIVSFLQMFAADTLQKSTF